MGHRSRAAARPRHDDFAQAAPIEALPFTARVALGSASVEPREPSPCMPSARTVWYTLVVPRDGTLILDLAGSTRSDVVVRLYRVRSGGLRGLGLVACASPAWNGSDKLEVAVGAGERYAIQAGTAVSEHGVAHLRVELL